MRLKVLMVLATVLMVAAGATVALGSGGTEEDPLGPGDHINICHSGNGTNFEFISPSASSGGPAGHEEHEADIFAGYWFQQNQNADPVYIEGQNTDLLYLLDTDCVPDDGGTTTEPPPPTDCNGDNDPTNNGPNGDCTDCEDTLAGQMLGCPPPPCDNEPPGGSCQPPPRNDVCKNLGGVQLTVPVGYTLAGGLCVQPDPPHKHHRPPGTVTGDCVVQANQQLLCGEQG